MGDINIDMQNGTLLNTNWKQQTELYDFTQIVNDPTRVTAHSEKIKDHVYASDTSKIAESFVPRIAISNHYPVKIKRQSHTKIQYTL